VARAASLNSDWLPCYGWWPPPDEVLATVVMSPYHAATESDAVFHFTLRGYLGSSTPLWEYEVGELALGEEGAVRLSDLGVVPEAQDGGILEVHGVRLDREPRRGIGFVGQWIDAETTDGGGYIIPTIPIRAQRKDTKRDDLQVVPGIQVSRDVTTEVLLLNVVDEPTEVRLVATSTEGLTIEAPPFTIDPWTPRRVDLRRAVPGLRRLLEPDDGMGSLAIYSTHRLLPYFGYRRDGGPLLSLDHTAPIFA